MCTPEERKKKYLRVAEQNEAAAAQAYEKYLRGESYPIRSDILKPGPDTWKSAAEIATKAAAAARRAAKDTDGQ